VFALAGYIGRARERVTDPEERRRFASSCSEAGLRAKAAAGFTRAAQHFADALALLDGIALDRSAELDVLLEHAECLILAGELGAGERAYTRARARVRDELALARVLLSHVTLAMVPGDTARALELTLEAAAAFDLDLQVGGDAAWFGATLTATMREVEQIGHAAIIRRPLLDDPLQACVCRLLLAATNAAYLAGDIHLYGALACAVVRIGLAHGVDDAVGVGFIQIAIILASGVGDYAATRRYASLAEAVIERVPGSPLRGMFEVIRGSTIQPWVEVMAASIPRLEQAHVRLRADGMLTSAGYAWFCVVMNGYCAGFALPRVVADAERTVAYLDSIGDRPLALATQLYADSAELLGSSELDGPDKLAPLDPEQLAALNPASYFSVHAVQAFTCLLLDDDDGLTAAIAAMGPAVAGGTGLIMWIVHRVVVCLHACARYRVAADDERAELAREIEQELAWLERWQVSCSSNAACWQHLVAAAWAEARAQLEQARREYARAADLAEEVGHHHVVGFANARGARVALALGDRRHAVGFLEHALTGYTRWGARRLERRISEQLRRLGHARPTRTDESTLSGVTGRIHALDVSSIVKMSLALSETTSLAEVIERLLRTTSENAGADRGALLLLRDGAVELHAIQEVGAEVRTFAPPLELDAAAELVASAVIRACIDRGAAVIVDDAQASADAHARASGLRSILALPVDSHGARLGVLYFENHVTPGAFTQQHLRVLNTLAAQAAVILDSARLFAALREREARWRALVDSAPDVILIVDRAHRIELCNRPEFWRGHEHAAIEELFTPEQRERVAAAVDYVFATGKHGSFEATRELPTGQRRVTARLGPIVRDGVIDRVTLIATDITEQRELELQFRQAQKMQAIGTLAGGVAHDFNNLLTVILGACDMGRFDLDDHQLPADALVRTSLVEITEAAERAASLTRQLLAFSRKQVLKPVDFDLDELVSGLARMLRRLLGESITLELRLADRPCWLHADRGQIEQVVMNLAVNARDAMPRGGALTLTTAHHEITSADATDRLAPGRYVALGVHDTGTGISPELVRRIFEPFFTTKEPGKGTGLGLSTVLGIVEQSGGKIDVDTRLGRGTSFRVLLPAARERELALADDEPELPRGYETLLVVEDDAPVRSLVVQMLASLGYRVLEAGEGEAATQAARAQTELDLALVDLVLPGASGREVGELLTRLHPRVKLLYTSGYIDDAFNPNRSDLDLRFVHKPFNRAQLARAVRRLLDGEL
jgi:PAS domain S-box-containing protein